MKTAVRCIELGRLSQELVNAYRQLYTGRMQILEIHTKISEHRASCPICNSSSFKRSQPSGATKEIFDIP